MQPFHQVFDCDFYVGDVLTVCASMPEKSVHAIVTSPPYFGLRDYGIAPSIWGGNAECEHEWGEPGRPHHPGQVPQTKWVNVDAVADGGRSTTGATCSLCSAWRGVFGLENLHDCLGWAKGETPCAACFICHMRTIASALWRVLRDDGTLFLNIGDSYSGSGKGPTGVNGIGDQGKRQGFVGHHSSGLSPKNRFGIPERLALALQSDGWVWRDTIHLCKTSPMPESVRDRTTQAHEPMFMFTKKARYYFDNDAVREPSPGHTYTGRSGVNQDNYEAEAKDGLSRTSFTMKNREYHPLGHNPRSWMLWKPERNNLKHYAAYPRFIPRFAILAGSSEYGVCAECGAPWERVTETTPMEIRRTDWGAKAGNRTATSGTTTKPATSITLGWRPTCTHDAPTVPATIFDPFSGSGTTQVVARELGRRSIYCDLSPEYGNMAIERLEQTTPMLPIAPMVVVEREQQTNFMDGV